MWASRLCVPPLVTLERPDALSLESRGRLAVQLPTDIEVQTIGDDGNKVRVPLGDLINGKKVTAVVNLTTGCS